MIEAAATYKISETEFFRDFPESVLEVLEKASTVRKFRKNAHIILAGEECHAAYVLLGGTAYVFTDDADGNEYIISSFAKGDCFGELGLLDDKPRTANVKTTSDCECLVIPKSALIQALQSDPAVALTVIRSLVGRIRGMTDDVSCLALMDVYGRLIRVIKNESVETSDGVRITERMTHKELANRVGSSREMVSKILRDLREGGYIRIADHRIVLEKTLPEKW